jgi:hypothetical protein
MTSSFGKKFEDSSPLVGLLLVKVNEAFIGLSPKRGGFIQSWWRKLHKKSKK